MAEDGDDFAHDELPEDLLTDLGEDNATGADENVAADDDGDDPELEAMKRRVKEMEEEARKLQEMQSQVEKQMASVTATDSKEETDARSVYIGNVDYAATPDELQQHFASCGTINRVTIMCDAYSGQSKGFAYMEFADKSAVENSLVLDDSVFRGRQIKVCPKRTNVPGLKMRGRGGYHARGGPRGRYSPYGYPRPFGGYRPRPRFGNRRAHFQPY